MDAIDQIIDDAGKFMSGNSTYAQYRRQWQFFFESYVGGEEYRNSGHLTRYVNESPQEYAARTYSTPLQNHCNSVISVYNSFLFRQNPKREFGSIQDLPELQTFLKDADLDGRSFNSFMKDVSTYSSIFGHAWVIVTKPDVGAATRGDEISQGVRPYVSMLSPLTVLDWSWSRAANGAYTLDYFKYIEDVNGEITTCREWTPDFVRTVVIDEDRGVVMKQYVEPNGLGRIPAVIAYSQRSIIRGIGISDIADIASGQKYIFNALSEIEQSIRLDSHPSLVKTPETNAGVGAGAIIHMPENLDPGLKPYVLDFQGASVDKILAAIEQTVDAIDKMANTGAVRATVARTLSGVAMETEFQLLNARLSEKGDSLELAEEQIWRLWSDYMGYTWDGDIQYPDSFNLKDTANDLELYIKGLTAPNNSETYRQQLQRQIAKTVIEDDALLNTIFEEIEQPREGFVPHIMLNPETGAPRIANTEEEHLRLAALGYTHAGE